MEGWILQFENTNVIWQSNQYKSKVKIIENLRHFSLDFFLGRNDYILQLCSVLNLVQRKL